MTSPQKICGVIFGLLVGITPFLKAVDYPSWWITRGVVITNTVVTNDYNALAAGQLKHFATKAKDELDFRLTGGAGSNVNAVVSGFVVTNYNDQAVLAGQLKTVVQPFWDRLIEVGYTNANGYPWTASTSDDFSHAAVNIGQAKRVFYFDLSSFSPSADSDGDGMLDSWETTYFGNLSQTATGDYDSDGVDNLTEFLQGRNPTKGAVADTGGVVDLIVYTPFE